MDYQAYYEAHSRYQGYRDAAFDLTWDELHGVVPAGCDLRVMPIDDSAMVFWHAIRHFRAVHPSGGFPWDAIVKQARPSPRRFDIAVWDGDVLCGLAVGMPSRARRHVTVKWIERFDTHPNQLAGYVALVVLTAAEHYAKVLGCGYVRLKDPLPGTHALYHGLGFTLAPTRKPTIYWERQVP